MIINFKNNITRRGSPATVNIVEITNNTSGGTPTWCYY